MVSKVTGRREDEGGGLVEGTKESTVKSYMDDCSLSVVCLAGLGWYKAAEEREPSLLQAFLVWQTFHPREDAVSVEYRYAFHFCCKTSTTSSSSARSMTLHIGTFCQLLPLSPLCEGRRAGGGAHERGGDGGKESCWTEAGNEPF